MGERSGWLAYRIEEQPGGGPWWFFWSDAVSDWVSDQDRATVYPTVTEADAAAERARKRDGLVVMVVRESELC